MPKSPDDLTEEEIDFIRSRVDAEVDQIVFYQPRLPFDHLMN